MSLFILLAVYRTLHLLNRRKTGGEKNQPTSQLQMCYMANVTVHVFAPHLIFIDQ